MSLVALTLLSKKLRIPIRMWRTEKNLSDFQRKDVVSVLPLVQGNMSYSSSIPLVQGNTSYSSSIPLVQGNTSYSSSIPKRLCPSIPVERRRKSCKKNNRMAVSREKKRLKSYTPCDNCGTCGYSKAWTERWCAPDNAHDYEGSSNFCPL